jgi:hypothetical protein
MSNINIELENIVNSFKLKYHEKKEKEFERFIFEILRLKYDCLKHIRPYGNIGDWGVDCFCREDGKYFQVYAPSNSINVNRAISKINENFDRAYNHWKIEKKFKFGEWHFVLNFGNNSEALPPQIYECVQSIEKKYAISTDILLFDNIKSIVIDLYGNKFNEIKLILNDKFFDTYTQEQMLEFSSNKAMNEVIHFILNSRKAVTNPFAPIKISIETERKIQINGLDNALAESLGSAIDKGYLVEEYKKADLEYDLEDLKPEIKDLYKKLSETHIDKNVVIKKIFYNYFDDFPKKTESTQYALLIVIGHFFEICEIGDS